VNWPFKTAVLKQNSMFIQSFSECVYSAQKCTMTPRVCDASTSSMNHMALLDSRDVTHQLPHTLSLTDARLYMHTDGQALLCSVLQLAFWRERLCVCKIGGGGESFAGVGGLMFDWVSFVFLHTHGYTLIPVPRITLIDCLKTLLIYINLTSYFSWFSKPFLHRKRE